MLPSKATEESNWAEVTGPIVPLAHGPPVSSSTMVCTPASLSQEVGLALGAQAGERQLREVATETPFNLVLEARP